MIGRGEGVGGSTSSFEKREVSSTPRSHRLLRSEERTGREWSSERVGVPVRWSNRPVVVRGNRVPNDHVDR